MAIVFYLLKAYYNVRQFTVRRMSMEDMIKKILEIDAKAREMTAKSEAMRTEAKSSINQKKEELRREFNENMQARIVKFEKSERQAAENQVKENDEQNKAVMDNLNKVYENNVENWINTLFEKSIE